MDGGEDPRERDARLLGDVPDGFDAALELAEHDLVVAEEQGAEVLDAVRRREGRNCLLDTAVECFEIGVRDTGPEALCDEPFALRTHPDDARRRPRPSKAGAPYEIAPGSRSSVRPSCARDEMPSLR